MIYFATLLISMFTTIVLVPIFMGLAVKFRVLDIPGKRKVHEIPIPKTGGISMTLGALVPILLWAPVDVFIQSVLIGSWIIVLFGLLDDFKDLDYRIKFSGQVAAACIVVLYGGLKINDLGNLLPSGYFLPDILSIPLAVIVIVGVTNAINLSDGLDGLAGGICLLSFICIGYLAFQQDVTAVLIFSVAIIGAILGFLRFNTYPATVFMGDAGSQLLGFLFITMSLYVTQNSVNLSPVLPLILIGLPILDTVTVMIERMLEGRSPFQADKKHIHHKLLRLGLFHNESVLVLYCIQAFLVTSGFIFRGYSERFLLIFYLIVSLGIISFLPLAERRGWRRKKSHLLDKVIKGRLRVLKDKQLIIKVSFKSVLVGVPLIFLFSCTLPQHIPEYFSSFSMGLLAFFIIMRFFRKKWEANIIRLPLFLIIPFIVYFAEIEMSSWMSGPAIRIYNASFVLIVFLVIVTLRFSRRKGFKSTPMDFLILFIALVIPNLPDEQIKSYQMGLVAAKIIALFFSFEVLIGELRVDLRKIAVPIVLALIILTAKGYWGI